VGLRALWVQMAMLAGFAVLFVVMSVRRFHKTVD
jgi:hypothetical protein